MSELLAAAARAVLHLGRDQLRGCGPAGQDGGARRALLRRRGGPADGVSVDYDDWHFNIRPSNTEPLLRLNLESLVSAEHMEEKRDEVLALIWR
jgi:phosphomannomutase